MGSRRRSVGRLDSTGDNATLSSPHTARHALGGHPEASALECGSWPTSTFRCAASVAARSWISQIQVPGKSGSPTSSGSAWNAAATFGRRIPSRKRPSQGSFIGGRARMSDAQEAGSRNCSNLERPVSGDEAQDARGILRRTNPLDAGGGEVMSVRWFEEQAFL